MHGDAMKAPSRESGASPSALVVLYRVLTACLLVLLPACTTTRMPEGNRPAGVPTVRADLPQRVAILPLVNGTERTEAPEIIRAALQQQLNATPYTVQKIFLTDALLAQGGLRNAEQAAAASLSELGRLLNVDAILVGRATEYTPIYAVVYAQVAVGASVKLVDVRSGAVLWEGAHVQRSHGGSVAVSPWGLIAAAGMTALHLRDAEFLHATDDLARELVAGMPVSTVSRAFRPPARRKRRISPVRFSGAVPPSKAAARQRGAANARLSP